MTLAERHAVVAYGHELRSKFQVSLLQCGSIGRGMYAQQLMGWLRYNTLNENVLVVRFEDFVANGTSVLEKKRSANLSDGTREKRISRKPLYQ